MRFATLTAFIVVLFCGPPAYAALPSEVSSGPVRLSLAAKAKRENLFVDMYEVGLYLPATPQKYRVRREARSFVINILYEGSLPGGVPEDWKEELLPPLSSIQQEKLREAYAGLKSGDTIQISYFPRSGTRLMINGRLVLHDRGPGLINAFEDLWLGANAVSMQVKQGLLSSGRPVR